MMLRMVPPMPSGYCCLLLHAHLPFVRHPEYDDFLEERWLFEAITETYLPLLRIAEGWERDRLKPRLALSFSPTLLAMVGDDLLRARYERVLAAQIRFARKTVSREGQDPAWRGGGLASLQALLDAEATWKRWGGNLLSGFRWLIGSGFVEPWTTAATHALLPLWKRHPFVLNLQIGTGVEACRRALGGNPKGFWLPECGYFPGLEGYLKSHGIRAFAVETHGLTMARPTPEFGVYAPVRCPNGVAVFGRDPEASRQVWSRSEGYPGDPWYREFHRDLGFERPVDELDEVLVDRQFRAASGVKPYRVTGGAGEKQPYDPVRAGARVREHARHFVEQRRLRVRSLAPTMNRPPVIVAPYDAELFGHWWYEGIDFIDQVVRLLDADRDLAMAGMADLAGGELPEATPIASTWGEWGHHQVWIHESNAWVWPHQEKLARRLEQAFADFPNPDPFQQRILNQATRELLAAQASDWPFMIQQGTTVSYAEQRLKDHLQRGNYLLNHLDQADLKQATLEDLEELTPIFPWLKV